MLHSSLSVHLPVPEDLSHDERDELSNIRRRKKELLDDIEVGDAPSPVPSRDSATVDVFLFPQRLKFEIAEVMTEIEQLTCVGER